MAPHPPTSFAAHAEAIPFSYHEAMQPPPQQGFRQGPKPTQEQTSAATAAPVDHGQREAQCRLEGRTQGQAESRASFEEQLGRERTALAKTVFDFSRDRAAYYQRIEEEAVRLALSIARKILHRESQVDPLLLMGVVRVALGKIAGATAVTLRVYPQRAPDWRQFLAAHMDAANLPEVVEDPLLAAEQCVLQTSMGSADLTLEVQLKEIENGLMDLLGARPTEKER